MDYLQRVSLPDYPTAFWISAVFAVVLVGISKAGFGGGAGVIATPLMALTIPVPEAAALLLPLLIVIDLLAIRHYHDTFDRPSIRLMIPSAVVGIVLGALFFGVFASKERVLEIGIGVLGLLFLAFQLLRTQILGAIEGKRPPAAAGIGLSVAAGFTSTLAHAGGPPAAIYLLPQRLPRQIFVGTTVVFFTIVNLVKLVPYGLLGLLRVGNLTTILILAPLGYVGVRLGIYLNRRFTDVWFNRLVYALLLLTSVQLLAGESLVQLAAR